MHQRIPPEVCRVRYPLRPAQEPLNKRESFVNGLNAVVASRQRVRQAGGQKLDKSSGTQKCPKGCCPSVRADFLIREADFYGLPTTLEFHFSSHRLVCRIFGAILFVFHLQTVSYRTVAFFPLHFYG